MKRSLRTQLFASHLALVALMAFVMAGAVINFFRLGNSIDRILRDNYQSVRVAQVMKEALERQDSAATFYLAGQKARARAQFAKSAPIFEAAYKTESSNITEKGENAIAVAIGKNYKVYKEGVTRLLRNEFRDDEARRFYFSTLEPQFLALKDNAQNVLDLNQRAIERADERAKREARQGASIGLIMTLVALGLAILFARRTVNAALTPLLVLVQEAEQIGSGHLNRKIELRRDDEVGLLARSFNDMAEKLLAARKVEQRRLHQAQRMSDAALENLFDPVLVTDATGTVVHLNRAAQGVFGPLVNLRGLPVARAIHEPKVVQAIERAIRQEQVSADEGEAGVLSVQEGESTRTYRLRATPMRDDDGTLLGAALVLEDVTHLRHIDRLKTEFISVASHELRTPVTSLLLSAQLLDEGAVGPLTNDQKQVVQAQHEDLMRLDTLLKDLLDIAKLEAGATPPRFEWIAPRDLVQDAVRVVETQAKAKSVILSTFSRDDLPLVRADRAQIGRVLLNLLNNAIRHTPAGGTVRLEAMEVETTPGQGKVQFKVVDTGDGIPSPYLERIFERFAQVPGATGGGSGLGLPISQAIVVAHGGTIEVESTLGQGSTFSFELQTQARTSQGEQSPT